jgi:hypothetical protein
MSFYSAPRWVQITAIWGHANITVSNGASTWHRDFAVLARTVQILSWFPSISHFLYLTTLSVSILYTRIVDDAIVNDYEAFGGMIKTTTNCGVVHYSVQRYKSNAAKLKALRKVTEVSCYC